MPMAVFALLFIPAVHELCRDVQEVGRHTMHDNGRFRLSYLQLDWTRCGM